MSDETTKLEDTTAALNRMQTFDVITLGRKDDLGQLNFEAAVAPARRLVELFRKVPVEILKDLPDPQLNEILNASNSAYKLFQQVLDFELNQGNPGEARDNLVRSVSDHYASAFPKLVPWINYGVSRTVDFNDLASEGRAAIQSIEDRGQQMEARLAEHEESAKSLQEQLRATLAEQGVGSQAQYFESEAKSHATEAEKWGGRTWIWAAVVAAVAVASFFTHKIEWLAPKNTVEAIQFVASKVLLFGVLTFMLVRSSRNYLAHRHNTVVNRHKQNSLLTFNALVEASSTAEARNTVLNHAAASIYAVPDTGYVKGRSDSGPQNTTLVELLPRVSGRFSESTQ